jgi:FemAB-related protein (PEP-CTERM system-associated)
MKNIDEQGASAVTVQLLEEKDRTRWDGFVEACHEATFFHRAGWQAVIEQAFGHKTWFFFAELNGEIIGVLPLAEIKSRLFGHSLSSLPFCVYGGAAVIDERARSILENAAIDLAQKLGVGHIEFRNEENRNTNRLRNELYVTFKREIDADEEKNMLAIPRKQRAMVRKGIKFGLQSELDTETERFFDAYSQSVHRLGTPVFSRKYFALLKQTFGQQCEVVTITHEGKTVASVMSFYFRDTVLPYYGGGTDEARNLAANDFMYWELMRRASARGLKIFDFGRSKVGTGAYDFKKNWGFEPKALHYEYSLIRANAMPENNPLNPKYRLFIKMWQKMPIGLANLLGPHIVKNLG